MEMVRSALPEVPHVLRPWSGYDDGSHCDESPCGVGVTSALGVGAVVARLPRQGRPARSEPK